MSSKHCLALMLSLMATACSGEVAVVGADGLPLYVPREYLSDNSHSWWVGQASGMDKDEGVLVTIPFELLPSVQKIQGNTPDFIAVLKAKTAGQEEHNQKMTAQEFYALENVQIETGSAPGAQRIHYPHNAKSSWALFTRSTEKLAQRGADLVLEKYLAQCGQLQLAGVSCTTSVYVGPFDLEFGGPEELMVRHAELESDLKALFCSWVAKKGESREWCK